MIPGLDSTMIDVEQTRSIKPGRFEWIEERQGSSVFDPWVVGDGGTCKQRTSCDETVLNESGC
jgi:hypothetical protein